MLTTDPKHPREKVLSMHFARGLALVTGLMLASALAAHDADADANDDRTHPKDRTSGCYKTGAERAECSTITRQIMVRPVDQSTIKQSMIRSASEPSVRKRRQRLEREEVMCKVEVPAVMCMVPVRVQADASEQAKELTDGSQGVVHPAFYQSVRERVLVQTGSISEMKVSGC